MVLVVLLQIGAKHFTVLYKEKKTRKNPAKIVKAIDFALQVGPSLSPISLCIFFFFYDTQAP